jgi:hypothetical protein
MTYVMTPGTFELTEHAVHLVIHGDSGHADRDHAQDSSHDEHGCSGTYHACTCHGSPTFMDGAAAPRVPIASLHSDLLLAGADTALDSGFALGVDRPPRA